VRAAWQWWHEKDGGQEMVTAIKMAVVMVTRVVGKDEGDGEGSQSIGNCNKKEDCKEEGNGKQQWQWDDGNRDNNNNHNDYGKKYNDDGNNADNDKEDNNKDSNNNGVAGAAGGGWWRRGRATKAAVVRLDYSYIFIKTEFWVLLVVGEGQHQK
jgi:hypothetical protein